MTTTVLSPRSFGTRRRAKRVLVRCPVPLQLGYWDITLQQGLPPLAPPQGCEGADCLHTQGTSTVEGIANGLIERRSPGYLNQYWNEGIIGIICTFHFANPLVEFDVQTAALGSSSPFAVRQYIITIEPSLHSNSGMHGSIK